MKFTSTDHSTIAVLSFFSLIVFLHLGAGEIQPWNEGVNAMRARSLVEFGTFRDYTSQGLNSMSSGFSMAQPLNTFMLTYSMKLLGENEFSTRLFSAICSALSLLLLYLIARRFESNEYAISAALLLVSTLAWNTYSRQGMSNIPLTALFLSSLWAILKLRESDRIYKEIIWSFGLFVFILLGMMTEIVATLMITTFLFAQKGDAQYKRKFWFTIWAFIAAFAAWVTWFLILSLNGDRILDVFNFAPVPYSAMETGNNFGAFNFLNITMVSNPFFVVSIIAAYLVLRNFKKIGEFYEGNELFLIKASTLWFFTAFILYAALSSWYDYLIIYMIPPGLLLAVKFYSRIDLFIKSRRLALLLLTLLTSAGVWSFLSLIRRRGSEFFEQGEYISLTFLFYIIAIVVFLLYILVATEKHLKYITPKVVNRVWFALLLSLVIRIVAVNSFYYPGYSFGAEKTAEIIKKSGVKSFVYLYHQHKSSDSLNPQLAWYTDGWTYGWLKERTFVPVPMPENGINYLKLRNIDIHTDKPVIYYLPDDLELAESVIRDLLETRQIISYSQNYILFGKKTRNRPGGVMI